MDRDQSRTEDSEYRPDMDPNEWIVCPECGSEDAYLDSAPLYTYDGEVEHFAGMEHNPRCPDCGLWSEFE